MVWNVYSWFCWIHLWIDLIVWLLLLVMSSHLLFSIFDKRLLMGFVLTFSSHDKGIKISLQYWWLQILVNIYRYYCQDKFLVGCFSSSFPFQSMCLCYKNSVIKPYAFIEFLWTHFLFWLSQNPNVGFFRIHWA